MGEASFIPTVKTCLSIQLSLFCVFGLSVRLLFSMLF